MDGNYTKSRIAEIMNEKGVRQVDFDVLCGESVTDGNFYVHWFFSFLCVMSGECPSELLGSN